MRELHFGLPPADPASEKRGFTAELFAAIEQRHALRLIPEFAADYGSLVVDLSSGKLDAAWVAPLSLLRAERQARAILGLQRAGRGLYHGALIARRDADLVGIRDLAGKRMGWVDRDSAAGYVLTRALIAEQRPNLEDFLGPQEILGSHRAVVEAVADKRVDVGATFLNFGRDGIVTHSGWQEFLGARAAEIAPIAITGAIPGDVIAVTIGIKREDSAVLLDAFCAIAADPLFARVFNGAEAVVDTRPGEHDLLAQQARRAGWKP